MPCMSNRYRSRARPGRYGMGHRLFARYRWMQSPRLKASDAPPEQGRAKSRIFALLCAALCVLITAAGNRPIQSIVSYFNQPPGVAAPLTGAFSLPIEEVSRGGIKCRKGAFSAYLYAETIQGEKLDKQKAPAMLFRIIINKGVLTPKRLHTSFAFT